MQARIEVIRRLAIALLPALISLLPPGCGHGPEDKPSGRLLRLLDGDGIGAVRFGASPSVVADRLGTLFGRPIGAGTFPHGYSRSVCGFSAETWAGLGVASDRGDLVVQLTVWFRNSRFVAYSLSANNLQTRLSSRNEYASHPIMLATPKGLAVGDSLARGRRLYGHAFVRTARAQGTPPNRRLVRLPTWEASTPSGRLSGWIGPTSLADGPSGTSHFTVRDPSIAGIGAGLGPNTPC